MSNDVATSHSQEGLIASPSTLDSSPYSHSSFPSHPHEYPRNSWLRAHKGKHLTDDPETELHPFDFPDDIRSVYQNEDMADNEESLNDLLISLGENQAGPSDSVGEKEKTLESIILFIKGAPL